MSQKFTSQIPETVNHDFMLTHIDYVDRYQKFLRNQRYADGLLRQLLKDFNHSRNLRKVINHIPSLDEPKLANEKNELAKEMISIKKTYREKMDLVSNKFLKYDVSNDGLLEEVGRFIEFGNQQVDSESIVEEVNVETANIIRRNEQENHGLVDQLLNKIELKKNDSQVNLHRSKSFAP